MSQRMSDAVVPEARLLDTTSWLEVLAESSPDAIVALDLEGRVVAWSPGATRVVGYSAEEIVGRSAIEFLQADRAARFVEVLASVGTGARFDDIETTLVHRDGRRLNVRVTLAPIPDSAGHVSAVSCVARDVTASIVAERGRIEAEHDVATQQRILERIARGDGLSPVLEDICREVEARYRGARCSVLTVSAAERVLRDAAGPSLPNAFREAIDGMPIASGMGACGTAAARGVDVVVADILTDPLTAALRELARAHDLRSVWSHALVDRAGHIVGTFAVYCDVPHEPGERQRILVEGAGRLATLAIDRRRSEEALMRAALVDPLTGLPNRARFLELVERGLNDRSSSLAVMFFDLDQFKRVNDSLGHPAGDRLLRDASRRLITVLGEDEVLSRFGGDEFTILLRGKDTAELEVEARRLLDVFADPFVIDDREFFISASVGVAVAAPDSGPFDLIRDADVAMYQAKARGTGGWAVFDEGLRRRAVERVTLDGELHRALDRRELVVHYQPMFELRSGRCTGAEALVRWEHPTRGLLMPGEFVPLAEETGLILRLGALVLDEVLRQLTLWSTMGIEIPVAVNVSPIELSNPALVDEIEAALLGHCVEPRRLLLEITETAVMEQISTARACLERVAALGVGVFVDDFGTGYSSISRLSDLPVIGLKVDRRFTSALGTDPSMTKITMAIIDLARALDLQVVAEGVETPEALQELRALDCAYGQGFHLGRPDCPEAIAALF